MLKRLILAAVIAVLGSGAKADTWSIGYAAVPGVRDYVISDLSSLDRVGNGRDEFSFGMIQILYENSRPLFNNLFLTLTTGVGLPAGSQKFNWSKLYANVDPSTDSKDIYNEGDKIESQLTTVPIFIGAKYMIPVNSFSFSLGVSAGPVISALTYEDTALMWSGTPPNEIIEGKSIDHGTEFLAFFAVMVNLGMDYSLGGADSIGVSVPLGFFSRARAHYEETELYAPTAGPVNDTGWGESLGGFVWGINLGWTRRY